MFGYPPAPGGGGGERGKGLIAIVIDRLCSRSGGGKLSGPLLGYGQRAG